MLATIAPLAALPAFYTFLLMSLTVFPRGSYRDRRDGLYPTLAPSR